MNLTAERKQLAIDLGEALGVTVHASPPARFTPPVVILVPGDPYVTEDGAPFTRATMSMEIRVVTTQGQDPEAALADLETMTGQIMAWLDHITTGWDFTQISEPYSLATAQASFPALSIFISTLIER